MTTSLPVLPPVAVLDIRSPDDRFRCEPYACTMAARGCVQRQAKAREMGAQSARTHGLSHCFSCKVGAQIAGQLGGLAPRPCTKDGCTREASPGHELCAFCERGRRLAHKAPPLTKAANPPEKKLRDRSSPALYVRPARPPAMQRDELAPAVDASAAPDPLEAPLDTSRLDPAGGLTPEGRALLVEGAAARASSSPALSPPPEETTTPKSNAARAAERACANAACGKPFTPLRRDARYCSADCYPSKRSARPSAPSTAVDPPAPAAASADVAQAPTLAPAAADVTLAELSHIVEVLGLDLLRALVARVEARRGTS